jgi:7-cyano-7-deazaguanine synthase
MKKAVILLSGGLDSRTVLEIAKKKFKIYALSFDYGQRHKVELEYAKKIAIKANIEEHKTIKIDTTIFENSSLTDKRLQIPKNQDIENMKNIPSTYVPARNTIFLSFALAYCEAIGSNNIFIGANAVDYSNYPDCRPKFINAFEEMANQATSIKLKIKINAPLIELSKAQIIAKGLKMGIDYTETYSCYDPIIKNKEILPCLECDSCLLRQKGFLEANKLKL